MDPFISIEYKNVTKSTSVCKNGGKHPVWNGEMLEFKVDQMADVISIYCYDEDLIKNDLIASQKISIFHLCT